MQLSLRNVNSLIHFKHGSWKKKKKKRNKKHELLVIQIDYVFSLCEGGKKLDNCRLNKIIDGKSVSPQRGAEGCACQSNPEHEVHVTTSTRSNSLHTYAPFKRMCVCRKRQRRAWWDNMCSLLFQGSWSGPLIAMATTALQSGSHVLCFITNSTMTQYLSGFGAERGLCWETPPRPGDHESALKTKTSRETF